MYLELHLARTASVTQVTALSDHCHTPCVFFAV
jgi:hypothetical protein